MKLTINGVALTGACAFVDLEAMRFTRFGDLVNALDFEPFVGQPVVVKRWRARGDLEEAVPCQGHLTDVEAGPGCVRVTISGENVCVPRDDVILIGVRTSD